MQYKYKKTKGNYEIEQKWDGLAQHIAYVINSNTNVVILTIFTNILEVSVYAIYTLITNGIKGLLVSFSGGLYDSFGDMLAKCENDILNKNFKKFEIIYIILATTAFSVTFFLILPFVKIYMNGVWDVNHIRPEFVIIMVLTRFVWTIRYSYENLTKAAGNFKQTKEGAWFEAICNITVIELGIITLIVNVIPHIQITNYNNWILQGIIVAVVSTIVILTINIIIYKDNFKNIIKNRKIKLYEKSKCNNTNAQ